MAWTATHPDNTKKDVDVLPGVEGAPKFEIGFWPPLVADRINASLAIIRKTGALDDVLSAEFRKMVDLNHELLVEMIRWGVRGWTEELAPAIVLVDDVVGGIKARRLSDESVHLLCVNGLLEKVSTKCWLFNILTEDSKKKWGLQLPLGISTSPTSAPSAPPDGEEKP